MREIRYLDKLVDELAKGKAMEKILRKTLILSSDKIRSTDENQQLVREHYGD